MYRLEQVTKRFSSGLVALQGLDLEVGRGERVALIGPSGAGKTTLFRLLNLTLAPTSGRIFLDGVDTRTLRGRGLREARRRVGTIYQKHGLVPRLRVVHNVLAGRLGTWPLWKALGSLLWPAEREEALRVLKQVGIPEKLWSRTNELSGGQQQRVALARVLMQDPDVILADEPVSSVDPPLASTLIRLLVDLSQREGKTLLVSLHRVDLALTFFPRIIGMRSGRILFDRPASEVEEKLLQELYPDVPPMGKVTHVFPQPFSSVPSLMD